MIRLKRRFPWVARRARNSTVGKDGQSEPLREFVYLDEVSLGSLLASQKGEITENITSQMSAELVSDVGSGVSTKNPVLPSAEINSRFQTTNSKALQTVRKATAQSLFRELHKLQHIRKIQPIQILEKADSLEDVFSSKFSTTVHSASELKRGDLVEFKVKLSASWIFQMSTMVAELSEMFDESPTLFIEHVRFADLYQAQNANKIINKLLAGLIPVDGVVSDYVVLPHNGDRFIVHRDVVRSLDREFVPLRIVGVTEHLAYWKDIRRILFADNEFTMLCRLSKTGLQSDWNPIKVADIFREFAPDIAKQIEIASRTAMTKSAKGHVEENVEPAAAQMTLALARYKDMLLEQIDYNVADEQLSELDRSITNLSIDSTTAGGQRAAFAAVKAMVENCTNQQVAPSIDLTARNTVRKNLDLPLFPQLSQREKQSAEFKPPEMEKEETNLLDVEVVAIYW